MYTQDIMFVKSDNIKNTCLSFLEKGKPYKAIREYKMLYRLFDPETDEEILDENGESLAVMIDQDTGCSYLDGEKWELVEPQDI